jgi:PAS domain S-box-containing protein
MSADGAFDGELWQQRLIELEAQLAEANETLDAIRNGDVDAVVVGGPSGQIVYTLENADRPYRVLVERMMEGAVTLGGDGAILYCNRSFAELAGQKFEQIVGSNLLNHVDRPHLLKKMLDGDTEGKSTEIGLLSVAGRVVPVNLSVVELQVEDGAPGMFCAIVTDLSENYARATELARSNARLKAEITERRRAEQSLAIALDAADMGNWELSLDGDAAMRSSRHDAIFGHPETSDAWGLDNILDHFLPEDRIDVAAAFEAAETSGSLEFEKRIRRASDGALRWVYIKGRASGDERPARKFAGIVLDVTERRLIDEQLRQAQKMEAIGQLTGGIAHDFNNLLMIIGGSLETLARRVVLDERGQRMMDAAQMGVARGAKLNQQLLAFARRQDMKVEAICINDLLPNFETLLDRALGETIRLEILRDPALWYCSTDPHQLETAILNLAINSRDAMPDGGSLMLTTSNEEVPATLARRWEGAPGAYVVTRVTDTGSGIPADLAARVFEPFFTTKGVGRGTGLGLSQVYGFAKQSGGFVTFDSELGSGTTVSIYLPRVHPPRASAHAEDADHLDSAADGAILIVEDDPEVLAATRNMVEELGYSVTVATSATAALDHLSRQDFDLVFSDVIMATGMTGLELAQEIERRYPLLPVLLTSGYTAHHLLPNATTQVRPLLHKPYTLTDLAAALQAAREGWTGAGKVEAN